jgi:16S rRNA (guanine966-N2)-methyltransferase
MRTRPTAERVREALFSVLGDVTGLSVLDLYAGSGALGIEAVSRGAERAVFVESWAPAAAALEHNLLTLGIGQHAVVLRLPLERARSRLLAHAPFDLVFCDPPWAELAAAERAIERVLVPGLLMPGARLAVEHPADEPLRWRLAAGPGPEPALTLEQTRRWGDTAVSLFANAGPPPATTPRGL